MWYTYGYVWTQGVACCHYSSVVNVPSQPFHNDAANRYSEAFGLLFLLYSSMPPGSKALVILVYMI
jgi:hypothetical protein